MQDMGALLGDAGLFLLGTSAFAAALTLLWAGRPKNRRALIAWLRAQAPVSAGPSNWPSVDISAIVAVRGKVGPLLTYREDLVIGEFLRTRGYFEEDEIDVALGLIEKHSPRGTGRELFVDVGANIGTHTLWALKQSRFASAIAIEPEPGNATLLKCNLQLNACADRCDVLQLVASDAPGIRTLQRSPINYGDHRIAVAAPGAMKEELWETFSAHSKTLDEILDGRSADLIWIDTQGHEASVLAGAVMVLAGRAAVVAEFQPYALNRAGSYAKFRDIVFSRRGAVFDLKRTAREGRDVVMSREHLDAMFEECIRANDVEGHTDLLLLPPD